MHTHTRARTQAHTLYNAMGGIKTTTTIEQAGEQNLTNILSDRQIQAVLQRAIKKSRYKRKKKKVISKRREESKASGNLRREKTH